MKRPTSIGTLVDVAKVREVAAARGWNITDLARAAGLTRQAVHYMLKEGYTPFKSGFRSVAGALGVDPSAILVRFEGVDAKRQEVLRLAALAADGNARAFEMLPAALLGWRCSRPAAVGSLPAVQHQLLAAAAEVARTLAGDAVWIRRFASAQAARAERGCAFFFGAELTDPLRAIQATPAPMRKHLVFGAFDLRSFKRHLQQ